jgi:hypothetical protein
LQNLILLFIGKTYQSPVDPNLVLYSNILANGGGMREQLAGQYGQFDQRLINNYLPNQLTSIYPNIQHKNLLNQLQQYRLNNQFLNLIPQVTTPLNLQSQTALCQPLQKFPKTPDKTVLEQTKVKKNNHEPQKPASEVKLSEPTVTKTILILPSTTDQPTLIQNAAEHTTNNKLQKLPNLKF